MQKIVGLVAIWALSQLFCYPARHHLRRVVRATGDVVDRALAQIIRHQRAALRVHRARGGRLNKSALFHLSFGALSVVVGALAAVLLAMPFKGSSALTVPVAVAVSGALLSVDLNFIETPRWLDRAPRRARMCASILASIVVVGAAVSRALLVAEPRPESVLVALLLPLPVAALPLSAAALGHGLATLAPAARRASLKLSLTLALVARAPLRPLTALFDAAVRAWVAPTDALLGERRSDRRTLAARRERSDPALQSNA